MDEENASIFISSPSQPFYYNLNHTLGQDRGRLLLIEIALSLRHLLYQPLNSFDYISLIISMKDNNQEYRQFMNTPKQPRPANKSQAKSSEQFDAFKYGHNFPPSLQQKLGSKVPMAAYQQKFQNKSPLQIGVKNEILKPQTSQNYPSSQYDQGYYTNGNGQYWKELIEGLEKKVKYLQQQAKIKQAENTRKQQSWMKKSNVIEQENKKLKEDLIRLENQTSVAKLSQQHRSQIERLTNNVKKVEGQNEILRQKVRQFQEEKWRNSKTESKYKIGKQQSQHLSKRQSSTSSNYAYGVNYTQSLSNISPLKNQSPSWKQHREIPANSNKPHYEIMIQKAQTLLTRQHLGLDQLKQAESFLNTAKNALQSLPVKNSQSLEAQVYAYTCIINLKYRQKEPRANIQPFLQFVLNFYDVRLEDYFEQKIVLLNNQAIYLQKDQPSEALRLYEQVLAIQERYYSSRDERRALTLNNIGCAWCSLNSYLEGKRYFDQALEIVRKQSEIYNLVKQNQRYYSKLAKAYLHRKE